MQTADGMDTANVRWQNMNTLTVDIQIDEEQSKDTETGHITEVVGYIAFAPQEESTSSDQDSDNDGLSDIDEENIYGTDGNNPDTDGDGLSDAQEIVGYNSDPFCRDTDKDGSSDLDEAIAGTDPRHPDTDGDGWLDGAERLSGSDPCDSTSTPKNP